MRTDEAAEAAVMRQTMETADRLVTVLGTMKGAAMKLGQTFSVIDAGLVPEEYREEFQAKLAKLQASAEPHSFKDIRKVVEVDLGSKLSAHFADFNEEPIAAASIGQVHRATLHDGRDVAVKVQYPGINQAIKADMQNLSLGLKLLARISPGLDSKEIANEVRERITEELDYELEAANHRAIARQYRGHPFMVVPDVITDLCRERVIVSEFVDGRRFDDILGLPGVRSLLLRRDPRPLLRQRAAPPPAAERRPAPGQLALPRRRPRRVPRLRLLQEDVARRGRDPARDMQAVHESDNDALFELMRAQGVVTGRDEHDLELLMRIYQALCGWLLVDEEVRSPPISSPPRSSSRAR